MRAFAHLVITLHQRYCTTGQVRLVWGLLVAVMIAEVILVVLAAR